jgi:TDG/mug DNA glycosylase family protein
VSPTTGRPRHPADEDRSAPGPDGGATGAREPEGDPTDDPTLAVYEASAARWRARRLPADVDAARALAARAGPPGGRRPLLDAGCGPGFFTAALGPGVVALDGAAAMLDLVAEAAPAAARVRADLAHLPFRRGGLGGAFARNAYVHVPRSRVPLALRDLHRALAVGAPVHVTLFAGDQEHGEWPDDDFPGRRFSLWPRPLLDDVLVGAGFLVDELHTRATGTGAGVHLIGATRARTLADTVAPGLRVLVCGLNPSVYAADAGVGFARPGNRFWPAAVAAGLVSRPGDADHALRVHGVGMTDLVKRATPGAAELTADEYRAGMARLERLVRWLTPGVVLVVGLAGWRAAVDRRAAPGPQPEGLGDRPVYVMPNTSGLNARSSLGDLTDHITAALALAAGDAG